MPAQWFFVPFVRRDETPIQHGRYCLVDDFTARISGEGGTWAEFECGGGPNTTFLCGAAGVKVGGVQQATLDAIAAVATVTPAPAALVEVGTSLSVVNTQTRNFIERTLTKRLGYTDLEIDAWLGGQPIGSKSFGQLLDFLATRWYRPVYEPTGSQVGYQGQTYPGVIACDGRTTTSGVTSTPMSPVPRPPADVALAVPST